MSWNEHEEMRRRDRQRQANAEEETVNIEQELTVLCALVFGGVSGQKLLRLLHSIHVERVMGPGASDAMLRHADANRQLILQLIRLTEKGQMQAQPKG
jgi:hypothetical protein